MDLTIGFSTCPNDTYIFDALVNGRIDTRGIVFTPILADVEELNSKAKDGELDITKLSYHAYGHVSSQYKVLDAGSALGWGNGPLLVSKRKIYPDEINEVRIAIPGELTTANFLMGTAFPGAGNKKSYLFSDIEEVVLSDEADVGVLIHENRFTYMNRGLELIMDLGEYWEKATGMPIPLGGIVVNRKLNKETQLTIQELIRESLIYANENPGSSYEYMKCYAQDMRKEIMLQHVETFVNDFSLSLGDDGRKAVMKLLDMGSKEGLFPVPGIDVFV